MDHSNEQVSDEKCFQIVFQGEILPEYTKEEVVKLATGVFKISVEKAEALVSLTRKRIVKDEVSADRVDLYKKKFRKAGLKVYVVEVVPEKQDSKEGLAVSDESCQDLQDSTTLNASQNQKNHPCNQDDILDPTYTLPDNREVKKGEKGSLFKSRLFGKLMGIGIVLLFIFIGLPFYQSAKSIPFLYNPKVGDYLIINRGKLDKYSFITEKYSKYFSKSFQVVKVTAVDEKILTGITNSVITDKYDTVKKGFDNGENFKIEHWKNVTTFNIPRDELQKLNIVNAIVSAHRNKRYNFIEYLFTGAELTDADRHQEAIPYLQKALEIEPNAVIHYCLGAAYFGIKDYEAALEHYRKAITFDDEKDEYHRNAGNALVLLKRPEESLSYYKRSLELNPQQPVIVEVVAHVLLDSGDVEGAISYYKRCFETNHINDSILLNYMEALIVSDDTNLQEIDGMAEKYGYFNEAEFAQQYDMLKLFAAVSQNRVVEKDFDSWKQKYSGEKLEWNFSQLETWIDKKSDAHIQSKLLKLLAYFKNRSAGAMQ